MKNPQILTIALIAFSAAGRLLAEPIDFSEVSLLVRAHESRAAILDQVTQRKLAHPLTPQQENTLRRQGASDSLINALHQQNLVLSADEASAFEARREEMRKAAVTRAPGSNATDSRNDLEIFDVALGHPVNLTQWGGPDFEFVFNPQGRLDDGRPDAFLIDSSYVHTATYLGAGRPDDSTTIFDRRDYVSVVEHTFGRAVRIDRCNPVRRQGVPYTLYPVYAAGGVSLYYIATSADSVKLAVATTR
ncbi:MAG: hypothetical protein M3Y86_03945 [Verrucomicrobiota bacterium]|nr:hypothetical protein [Verrucomicrobiota bacterium]